MQAVTFHRWDPSMCARALCQMMALIGLPLSSPLWLLILSVVTCEAVWSHPRPFRRRRDALAVQNQLWAEFIVLFINMLPAVWPLWEEGRGDPAESLLIGRARSPVGCSGGTKDHGASPSSDSTGSLHINGDGKRPSVLDSQSTKGA